MTRSTVTYLVLIFVFLILVLVRREDPSGDLIRTRMLMGTVVEIRVLDSNADRYDDVVTAAFAEMSRIEALMSPHVAGSEINRISASAESVTVADETAEVLALGLSVSARSRGAFNIGLGQLIKLWGFAEGDPAVPVQSAIEQALEGVGQPELEISGGRVSKRSPRLAVDLGGVAKGYAIDRAIEVLAAAGIRHASVNAGGDMRLLGDRAGSLWRVGIQHPRQTGQILARINLKDRAVVTSGDYERYFEQAGVRYHHILDPRTGFPAIRCQAVTVIADNAAFADAMATAVFVLGPERGMELLETSPEAEGLIVAADGSIRMTEGIRGIVTWP